ncbi:MAG: RluA family pseudouridine synthase [Saprospiraceae bacterium]|nr:RluA family pseudouridine synthase [Saprospiraceae bacterium]
MLYTPEILYQDEYLVVAAKPSGLLTIPDRFDTVKQSLQGALAALFPRVWTVHRLDRETSGAILFALDEASHRSLSLQFEKRGVEKIYLALVEGVPLPESGIIDQPIGPHPGKPGQMTILRKGKSALTEYKVQEAFRGYSLVEANIHTGRTHQVRVHLASIGHPLVADPLYGRSEALFLSQIKSRGFKAGKLHEEQPLLHRTALHAWRVAFDHPHTGERVTVEAPLPKDLRAAVNQLRKWRQ